MVEHSLDPKHAAVIGNGVDLQRFQPEPKQEARRTLGVPQDARVCVAVGALIPRKGFHLLIPAFARLLRTMPEALLYILGEGAQRGELEDLARTLQIRDRIHLPGKVPNEQLRWWYSAADVSCLVSSREGWPNVLLESLACGTPVVATSVWGVPEVITSPALGILVKQEVLAITAGLERALGTKWQPDTLIAHARSRTWDVVAQELEIFLEEMTHP
jgi:glycosyltransferase involved in cell wall biosynthesis